QCCGCCTSVSPVTTRPHAPPPPGRGTGPDHDQPTPNGFTPVPTTSQATDWPDFGRPPTTWLLLSCRCTDVGATTTSLRPASPGGQAGAGARPLATGSPPAPPATSAAGRQPTGAGRLAAAGDEVSGQTAGDRAGAEAGRHPRGDRAGRGAQVGPGLDRHPQRRALAEARGHLGGRPGAAGP